ncbi:MAG: S26 family signal peptidase, partial [Planctomycetota bacterium]
MGEKLIDDFGDDNKDPKPPVPGVPSENPLVDDFHEAPVSSVVPPQTVPAQAPAQAPAFSEDLFGSLDEGKLKSITDAFPKDLVKKMGQVSGAVPPIAPAPAAQAVPLPSGPLGWVVRFVRENIECLVVAAILALVIRHFIFEPFQIPTGSMATTLLGKHVMLTCDHCGWDWARSIDEKASAAEVESPQCPHCLQTSRGGTYPAWGGEKIIANKMVYRFGFREPRRFETVVFHPPTQPHLNYIKRIVGFGGEELMIRAGDVFINGKIERKPLDIQRTVWIPVYSSRHDIKGTQFFAPEDTWTRNLDGSGRLTSYTCRNLHDRVTHWLRWERGAERSQASRSIWNAMSYVSREPTAEVGDLKIEGMAVLKEAGGSFIVEILDGPERWKLEIGNACRLIAFQGPTEIRRVDIPYRIVPGAPFRFSLENWDSSGRVELGEGEGVVTASFDIDPVGGRQGEYSFRIGVQDSDAGITDLKVFRDIYYTPGDITSGDIERKFQVEKDSFFA